MCVLVGHMDTCRIYGGTLVEHLQGTWTLVRYMGHLLSICRTRGYLWDTWAFIRFYGYLGNRLDTYKMSVEICTRSLIPGIFAK